jgi:hypothetical protein
MVLRRIIDSRDVGKVLNTMHWHVHTLPDDGQCSFITGDLPILISGGLGRRDARRARDLPLKLFIAARRRSVIHALVSMNATHLEQEINARCCLQSRHIIVARDESRRPVIDRTFGRHLGRMDQLGLLNWKSPLVVPTASPPLPDCKAAVRRRVLRRPLPFS